MMATSTRKLLVDDEKVALEAFFAPQNFLGKPTKRCIAKEAPFLIDAPFGLGGKNDRRVHR